MLESLRTTRGRIVIALVASLVIAALWLAYDLPVAIMPAILSGLWIPVYATKNEPVSPRVRLWLWAVLGVGVLALGVGVTVFALAHD